MKKIQFFLFLSIKVLILDTFLIQSANSLTPIGVDCIFKQGDRMNCRDYCAKYFSYQPQLAWYNITSHKCEPLKICSWYLHYYSYENNECYTDATMKQIAPSEYPQSLIKQAVATFYIDNICVNGEPESGVFRDAGCYCFFLWEDSGKVDMNGYPYKCDKVIGPKKWKGYFINQLILGPNSTVLMYGQYTPQQLQVIYQQLKQKELEQTYHFVYKYEHPLLFLIDKQIPQQSLIRQDQIVWLLIGLGLAYVVFAFSYLRAQSQIIKATRKQVIKRIQYIIYEDKSPLQIIN